MRSPGPLTPLGITASLQHRLNMYALAAGAAGVCLLALSETSEAKVIYTKTNKVIHRNDIYALDLNRDGVFDFLITEHVQFNNSSTFASLAIRSAVGNAVEGNISRAEVLPQGAQIGPGKEFESNSLLYGKKMANFSCAPPSGFKCAWSGRWVNVTDRYLGLKFQIHGTIHFGWARFSTQVEGSELLATLTGYAYESTPNMGITAGEGSSEAMQTSGSDASDVSISDGSLPETRSHINKPGSLGELALGAKAGRPE